MADAAVTLNIGGDKLEIDDFTLGEVEELEDAFDKPLKDIDFDSAKGLIWLVYIAKRRVDPDFTIEDARSIRSSDLGDQDPPTPARKGTSRRANAGARSTDS